MRAGIVVAAYLMLCGLVLRGQDEPVGVAVRAFEAQARGDIDAFFSECITVKDEDAAKLRTIFGAASWLRARDLTLKIAAWSMSEDFAFAVMRGELAYVLQQNGEEKPMAQGVLILFRRQNGALKIKRIHPDPFLGLSILKRDEPQAEEKTARRQAARRQAAMDPDEFNAKLNDESTKGHRDWKKLTQDEAFAVAGQFPVIGDAIAIIYTGYDMKKNRSDLAVEIWNEGLTDIALAKGTQLAVGIAQIITELIRSADFATDQVAIALDQATYNAEVNRALTRLRAAFRRGGMILRPRMRLPANLSSTLPLGLRFDNSGEVHSAGEITAQVTLATTEGFGAYVPFQVAGEIEIAAGDTLERWAKALGGVQRGDRFFIPVDITGQVSAPPPSEDSNIATPEDLSRGDAVLDHVRLLSSNGVSRLVVAYRVTCHRGQQQLAVKMRNGETATGPKVVNAAMNAIESLRIKGTGEKALLVLAGSRLSGWRFLGASSALSETDWPELKNMGECFNAVSADTAIAEVESSPEGFAIDGKSPGKTEIKALLGGSIPENGIPDVEQLWPLEVQEAGIWSYWQGPKWYVQPNLFATVMCQEVKTKAVTACATGLWFETVNRDVSPLQVRFPISWLGRSLTVGGQIANGLAKSDVIVEATLSQDGSRISGSYTSSTTRSDDPAALWRYEVKFENLPYNRAGAPQPIWSSYTWSGRGANLGDFIKSVTWEQFDKGALIRTSVSTSFSASSTFVFNLSKVN